jgi:hypothetical protein
MQLIKNRELRLVSRDGSAASAVDQIDLGQDVPGGAQAVAILETIDVQFANRDDHHLGRLFINLFPDFRGPGVSRIDVLATCALRDWSGGDADFNGDDPFEAKLGYSVLIV